MPLCVAVGVMRHGLRGALPRTAALLPCRPLGRATGRAPFRLGTPIEMRHFTSGRLLAAAGLAEGSTVPETPKDAHGSEPNLRTVSLWLFVCSGLVFLVIIIGGITRLTESG
eukprot:EG_transcript_55768